MSYVVAAAVVDDNFRCLEMSAAQLNRAPGFMQAVMNNDKLLDSSEWLRYYMYTDQAMASTPGLASLEEGPFQ